MPGNSGSLADHVCLAVVAEGPTHGWALVKLLRPDGDLGRIWSLSRGLTYRSIDRLVATGSITRYDGVRRSTLEVSAAGRRTARRWLGQPVEHVRDLRTEFLLKLHLHTRSGLDPSPLVERQRDVLRPALDALTSGRPDDHVALWRQESAIAAQRFLDRIGDVVGSTT
jgi:DNA-binding PadR family transcriptional regulator